MPELLYVIDTFSLLFQVYHGIPEMTGPAGQPTNAVFGFFRDLLGIIQQKKPTHLICAIDLPGPGRREQQIDPQYKANRSPMPENLRPQIPMVQELLAAFGIPVYGLPEWEADDLLATIVHQSAARDMDVCVVSSDKDVRQLLSPRVKIYNVRKGTYLDTAGLLEDWGVRPDQVIDYQSLVGDSVDNVAGVPLVGPKKAAALLQEFGTLDSVLANADKAPGAKLKENLKTYADRARLSRQLVTLYRDLPVTVDWTAAELGRWSVPKLQDLCTKFGFRKFKDEVRLLPTREQSGEESLRLAAGPVAAGAVRLGENAGQSNTAAGTGTSVSTNSLEAAASNDAPATASTVMTDVRATTEAPASSVAIIPWKLEWHVIDTPAAFETFLAELKTQKEFCLDLETTHLDPLQADIVGWAFSWQNRIGYYLPVRGPEGSTLLDPQHVIDALQPILNNPAVAISNQNIKYDLLVLRRAGVSVTTLGMDPMVGSYLLNAGARTHNLDDLSQQYLNLEKIPTSRLLGTGLFQKRMDQLPTHEVGEYACEDAAAAWELAGMFRSQLRQKDLLNLYETVERPLIPVLVEMQFNGIRIDADQLRTQSLAAGEKLAVLKTDITELACCEFNIDSPKQLQRILFDDLKLPVIRKNKTGPSTDQDVLEELANLHPLPARMLDHRRLTKLKGTYLDALPGMINPFTGRVHTSFNQVVAATGRLSSSDPNLQNIPIRTPEGRQIRAAFTAGTTDQVLLCADYSQIELRMLAHFSGDAAMQAAFAEGLDIHTAVAAEVNGIPPEQVDSDMRRVAKAVNFGIIYGQSAFGLASSLGIPRDVAGKFIDNYFNKYSGVDAFFTTILEETLRTGYATTILGRRRGIEGIARVTGRQRNLAERTAINTVIQGSAADLIKMAMIKLHARLLREKHPAKLLLQIHDELVLETPVDRVDDLRQLVREEMENAMELNVPVRVDVSVGYDWLNAN